MNQPRYHIDPLRALGEPQPPDPSDDVPPDRRSWNDRLSVVAATAVILVAGAFFLTGCGADPVEEVAVGDVTENGQATTPPEDETVSLSGDVDEILTESALTVTDTRSEEPLLVLLTPATIVNGTAATLGGQTGSLAQIIPPDGTLQLIGTVDTFDSVALAERLGIVLNDDLFAPWDGQPVFIADQVETFDIGGELAADPDTEAE